MIHACLNQSAAKTAQELVVIVTRRDKWRQRVQWHKNLILKDAERVGRDAKSIRMRLVYYTKLMPFAYMNDGLGILGLYRRLLSFSIKIVPATPTFLFFWHLLRVKMCIRYISLSRKFFQCTLHCWTYRF